MSANMGWGHASNHWRNHWRGRRHWSWRLPSGRRSAAITATARTGGLRSGGAAYNWAGIYVGVNGGWGWGNAKWTADAVGGFLGSTGSVHDNGGVVGSTLGA